MPYRFLNYDLPRDRIAQLPAAATGERSDSRLLHAMASEDGLLLEDLRVRDIARLFLPGDLLILNNSRVRPARFFARHMEKNIDTNLSAPREIEVLLVNRISHTEKNERWSALARPMRQLRAGDRVRLSPNLIADVIGREESQDRIILDLMIDDKTDENNIADIIESEGLMPIPGYIRAGRADEKDIQFYQTVFAKESGSIAAPTAGLHFTEELLKELTELGVDIEFVSLHVGVASFAPVRDIAAHQMPSEHFIVRRAVLEKIKKTREGGGRVVAVGTTAVRALESSMSMVEQSDLAKMGEKIEGDTEIFIKPGHKFAAVDVLMTNFHQPETTHLLLVAAFIGEENVEPIYEHALRHEYRFLSYGDAMFLERIAEQ